MPSVQDDACEAGEFIRVPEVWFTEETPRINDIAQHRIAVGLRALYIELLRQPIPQEWVTLIREFGQPQKAQPDGR